MFSSHQLTTRSQARTHRWSSAAVGTGHVLGDHDIVDIRPVHTTTTSSIHSVLRVAKTCQRTRKQAQAKTMAAQEATRSRAASNNVGPSIDMPSQAQGPLFAKAPHESGAPSRCRGGRGIPTPAPSPLPPLVEDNFEES